MVLKTIWQLLESRVRVEDDYKVVIGVVDSYSVNEL